MKAHHENSNPSSFIQMMQTLLGGEVLSRGAPALLPPKAYWSDSRKISPGDAFFALPGKFRNGNEFVESAVKNGARVVFMEKGNRNEHFLLENIPPECVVFLVENTKEALHTLARYRYAKLSLKKTIGVTGSVGKTTTKNLLQELLSSWYPSYATRESFNTSVGIDLALASVPEETSILILEFGANSFGEIRELTLQYMPEIGIITDIALAHTQGFASLEGVLQAKLEILESPQMETVFFNADSPLLASFFATASFKKKTIPVGWNADPFRGIRIEKAEVCSRTHKRYPFSLQLEISLLGDKLRCEAPFYCTHHAYACGFVLGVAQVMGIPLSQKADSFFENFQVPSGRGNILTSSSGCLLFDESYNANPKSMGSSLSSFGKLPLSGRKIAFLGGMKELGELSSKEHLHILSFFAPFDKIFLFGEEWNSPEIDRQIEKWGFGEKVELLDSLNAFFLQAQALSLGKGDALFIKGSRSYGLERIVEEWEENVES